MTPPRVLALLAGAALALTMAGCSEGSSDAAPDLPANGTADGDRGSETTVAGTATGPCSDVTVATASGYAHVDPGTDLEYEGVPPVSGAHWGNWEDLNARAVFAAEERPDPGQLVHSQEHGWTLVWFDESIDPESLESIAAEVADAGATKVAFVPWVEGDGAAFPGDATVAITHWGYEQDPGEEYRQFCTEADAAAIIAFAERYPASNSREPNAP